MEDMVRKLIQDRLIELKMTRKELSLAIDRDAGYISQFLVRGNPAELLEPERLKISEILKLPEDALRGPSTLLPKRKHRKKTMGSRESLIDVVSHLPQIDHGTLNVVPVEIPGAIDLPVYGSEQRGEGILSITDRAVEWVARPSKLLKVQDAYGIIVNGDSMSPALRPGARAYIHPYTPPHLGDFCLFRAQSDVSSGMIREYRGETETHWKVRQYTPARDVSLKKADWRAPHRIASVEYP
jgi:phage repressor protein C with HTH and peptisase S24 domain